MTPLGRERERRIESSLGFQIWGFGRENERAVGKGDAIYIQYYVLYFTKLPHALISFFFFFVFFYPKSNFYPCNFLFFSFLMHFSITKLLRSATQFIYKIISPKKCTKCHILRYFCH